MAKKGALEELLKIIGSDDDSEIAGNKDKTKISEANLEELALSYNKEHKFKPGDRVRLKKGLKHEKYPAYEQECVIVEVLPEPLYLVAEKIVATVHWHERQDIRVGIIVQGEFMIYHFDSRRFEPVETKKH